MLKAVGAAVGVGVLILGGGFLTLAGAASADCDASAGQVDIVAARSAEVDGFSVEQLANAASIMNAAVTLGLPARAQLIGVMTALGESRLRVLDYGDSVGPDSRGLFQQRDNGAWGSYSDRMDPTISATSFFSKLALVPGWEAMEPSEAAHTVQSNADPQHYTRYLPAAETIVATLTGATTGSTGSVPADAGTAVLPLAAGYQMTSGYGPRNINVAGASKWHPAVDLVGRCGDPEYAMLPGTVILSDRLTLSIRHPTGFTVGYLHMHKGDRLVDVGTEVTAGEQIGAVGNERPSSGCHLDIRINITGTTDPSIAALPTSPVVPG